MDKSKKIKNTSASIRQRLLNIAQSSNRPFQEVLQYYAIERFIDRFSRSRYKNKLILKGALMFCIWNLSSSRPTRDIDFLGITSNTPENINKIIDEISQVDCDDGIQFLNKTIECESIQEQNEYTGVRTTFFAELDNAKIKMQVDIGFGDVIHPDPIGLEYPTLLDMESPKIRVRSLD